MKTKRVEIPLSHRILRRPLLWVAACFGGGIFCHVAIPPHPGTQLILAAVLIGLAFLGRWPHLANGCLALAIGLLGLTAAQIESSCFPSDHVAQFTTAQPGLATVELAVASEPRILAGSPGGRPMPPRQVALGRVKRILAVGGWRPASGTIRLTLNDPHPDLAINQRIRMTGMLSRPPPAMNPGQADFQAYDRDQRILATLTAPHRQNLTILNSPGPTLLDSLRRSARRALGLGFTDAQALDHALLRALVLGDSDPQLRDVQDQFIRTGTSHHLAISGMHIAVLAMVVYGLCRLLFLSPRCATAVGLASAILYGLVALPSPPVIRSVLLCVAFGLGPLLRRSTDALQLLALSVLAMLIAKPLDLYNAGFQLSFGTVLGLILFTRPALTWLKTWEDPDLALAPPNRPGTLGQLMRWVRHALAEGIVTGLVAWLVAAPLIAFHFQQLNPWAIPGSLLLAIPVLLSLIGGIAKILITLVLPSAAPLAATLASWPVAIMRTGVGWLDHLPGSDVLLTPPPVWLVALYYLLLLMPLLPRVTPTAKAALRFAPALGLVLLLLPLFTAASGASRPRDARFTLLSVGAGQCALLQLPSGEAYVFDAGTANGDAMHRVIAPACRALGVQRINAIFLSHANQDHISAAAELVDAFGIDAVYLTPQFRADDHFIPSAFLQTLGKEPRLLNAGDTLPLGPGAALQVLWPPPNEPLSPNDASLVLRLQVFGHALLLPGDIQAPAERALVRTHSDLACDVLVAPHHGSADDATPDLLQAVHPPIILSSNDATLTRKQRAFETLTPHAALYRTHRHGALTLFIPSSGAITVRPHRPAPEIPAAP